MEPPRFDDDDAPSLFVAKAGRDSVVMIEIPCSEEPQKVTDQAVEMHQTAGKQQRSSTLIFLRFPFAEYGFDFGRPVQDGLQPPTCV